MGRVQELSTIEIESGVSLFDGKPFCHIHAKSHSGVQMGGQLRGIGLEDKVIGPFIVGLRERRS
jgi:hypothetical protein